MRRLSIGLVGVGLATLLALPAGAAPRTSPASTPDIQPGPSPVVLHPERPCVSRPRWRIRVDLSIASGVMAQASPTEWWDAAASIFVGGTLHFLWTRSGKSVGIGLHLAGVSSLGMQMERKHARVIGADAGFLVRYTDFWASTGLGFVRFSFERGTAPIALPTGFLALGYDIPLGQHFAIRLQLSGSTLLIVNYGTAGAGLVARF